MGQGERSTITAGAPHIFRAIKERPVLNNILAAFNFCIVLFSILCTFSGFFFVLISPIDLMKITYFDHGFRYAHLFFSLWGSAVQSVYFWLILAIDVIDIFLSDSTKWAKRGNTLKNIAPYLFYTAVFPMSVTIGMMFWGLYSVDRELIYPQLLDEVYPRWVNHAMHSIPVGLAFIYMAIERHREVPLRHSLLGMIAIVVFYAICIFYVKHRDDKWMYYGLHLISPTHVNCLLLLGTVSCLYTTILGHAIVRLINSL